MDCEKFNEYLTEYEAKRLTRKQELEFLQHKDVCEECNVVFNLVFNDSQIQNISYNAVQSTDGSIMVDVYNYENSMCCTIMDKIQNIERNSYNFKFYNIMHIVFGVITFGLIFTVMFIKKEDFYFMTSHIFKGTTNTIVNMNSGISQLSNHAVNSVEQCALYLYIVLLVAMASTYLFSVFKTNNK